MENESGAQIVKVQKSKKKIRTLHILEIAIGCSIGWTLGLWIFFLIPGVALGIWIAHSFVIKKKKIAEKWVAIIVWSNLISWIVPILGVSTGIFAIEVGKSMSNKNRKFLILGILGLLLSIGSFALGIYLKTGRL